MTVLEVVLLIMGGVIFVLGFVVPVSKEESSEETKEVAQETIHKLVTDEMESIRKHVDETVDEAMEYAMEKTERSLERLSNEKIMAVNEYSDTVLQEIHKNHEEVMFLYDMLNDKHENITQTVTEVNSAVKAVEATKMEAEKAVENFKQLAPESIKEPEKEGVKIVRAFEPPKIPMEDIQQFSQEVPASSREGSSDSQEQSLEGGQAEDATKNRANKNEEILRLYREGKDTVAIAQELGLGVGEVKLVIDLYKNLA